MLATTFFLFVTLSNINERDAAIPRPKTDEMLPIIFPDSVKDIEAKFGEVEVPDSCKDMTYCTEKPANYPDKLFNEMLKGYKTFFQPSLVLDPMLTNRQGEPNGRDDCESIVSYDPLYKVRAKRDSEWRIVVQAPDENYVQKVRLETCTNTKSPCFEALPLTPDIKTLCVQKFNKWEVLVAKGDNETEKIEVELPVCCSCQYTPPSIETRFGVSKKMSPAKTNAKNN